MRNYNNKYVVNQTCCLCSRTYLCKHVHEPCLPFLLPGKAYAVKLSNGSSNLGNGEAKMRLCPRIILREPFDMTMRCVHVGQEGGGHVPHYGGHVVLAEGKPARPNCQHLPSPNPTRKETHQKCLIKQTAGLPSSLSNRPPKPDLDPVQVHRFHLRRLTHLLHCRAFWGNTL